MRRLAVAEKTTVITGAASGMGAEVARQFAARGAHLALIDRNAEGLAAMAAELAPCHNTITTHVVDLADDDAVVRMADDVAALHPRIQTVINCAGVSMLGSFDQLSLEEMRWLMDINLWGTVSVTKAFLPYLRRENAAHITNLVSIYGLAAPAGRIPYAMTKFAARGFTEALRHELEGTNVAVTAVYPAGVQTGIVLHARVAAGADPDVAQRAAEAQAQMYHTTPADAAAKIVDATINRRPRVMIGREARLVDVLTRISPVHYWKVMRGPLREAIDTTTPLSEKPAPLPVAHK